MKSNPETNSSKPETRVREMKKILIMLLTMSFISSNDNFTKSTMSILERQSSKVLTNFQGEKLDQSNHTINHYGEYMLLLESGLEFEIQQIDEDTFEVLP